MLLCFTKKGVSRAITRETPFLRQYSFLGVSIRPVK